MFKFIALFCLAIESSVLLLAAQPRILPKSGTGTCLAGTAYTITSVADLKANVADLECIFAAAQEPDAIGLGFNYGTVLLGDNSVAVQPITAPVYQGDYVVRTTCRQNTVHLGTLKVAGISVGTAPWTLDTFTEVTIPGEAPINPAIKNIVMDFRQNVRDICPIEDAAATLDSKGFLPFRIPVFPVNCFVDLARVVGRDVSDGGIILLAKGMNNDPVLGWQTSLFYALKSFDPAVKPKFGAGTPITVPKTFNYVHNGFITTVSRFGGQGLLPFMMNAKRSILSALVSNPLVAAFALKDSAMSAAFPDQFVFGEMARNSLLRGLLSERLTTEPQELTVEESEQTRVIEADPTDNSNDEIVDEVLYERYEEIFESIIDELMENNQEIVSSRLSQEFLSKLLAETDPTQINQI